MSFTPISINNRTVEPSPFCVGSGVWRRRGMRVLVNLVPTIGLGRPSHFLTLSDNGKKPPPFRSVVRKEVRR